MLLPKMNGYTLKESSYNHPLGHIVKWFVLLVNLFVNENLVQSLKIECKRISLLRSA